MKTVNEQVHDELIRYNYALEKVGNGIAVKVNKEVAKTEKKLQALLADKTKLEGMGKLTKEYAAELNKLDKSIAAIRAPGFATAKQNALEDFNKLVQVEHDILQGSIKKAVPFDVDLNQVKPFVLKNIVALGNFSGGTFDQWFHNWQQGDLQRISGIVRMNLAQGNTMGDIERVLYGTRAQGYKDGALQVSRNVGTRLARTITNGTSNQSHLEFLKANSDVLDGVVFSAVRDGRVSAICNSLHGNLYKIDDASTPIPPLHPNCRSQLVPQVSGIGLIGEQPSVGGRNFMKDAKSDYLKGQKAKGLNDKDARGKWNNLTSGYKNRLMNDQKSSYAGDVFGKVPAKMSGDAWLKNQTYDIQKEVLGGKYQADLFKSGVSSEELIKTGTNKVMSVGELKKMFE